MPYITPASTPSGIVRRSLCIPNELFWIAAVNGALSELGKAYNWEDIDGITAEEAAARARQMFDEYLSGECGMIGQILAFCDLQAVPSNCLLLDGRTWDQADYPLLFDVLPSAWKSGITFTLPSMINHTLIGNDPDNPSTPPVQGTKGGSATHTLTIAEMPTHHHPPAASFSNFTGLKTSEQTATLAAGATHAGAANTGDTGGSGAHNNMPPWLAVVWTIVAL